MDMADPAVFLYHGFMRTKRSKGMIATPAPLPEASSEERSLLTDAYKSGLISNWKLDPEHGYRLGFENHRDEYVEAAKLAAYVASLRNKLR